MTLNTTLTERFSLPLFLILTPLIGLAIPLLLPGYPVVVPLLMVLVPALVSALLIGIP